MRQYGTMGGVLSRLQPGAGNDFFAGGSRIFSVRFDVWVMLTVTITPYVSTNVKSQPK